jgi:hypothetical protein
MRARQARRAAAASSGLFEQPDQPTGGPAAYSESQYVYLCRSARPEAARVRHVLESWLAEYPRAHRRDIVPRLRARDDEHFLAAFFELYVFVLLKRLGHRIHVHPRAGRRTSRRRPDFQAVGPDGSSTVIETVLAYEESAKQRATKRRIAQAYDALDRLDSPDFFLWIRLEGTPGSSVPGRKLRSEVARFLASLDHGLVLKTFQEHGLDALPVLAFRHDGCVFKISPFPKSNGARGKSGLRPVGVMGLDGARFVDHKAPTRDAVKEKARYYGRFRRPFVVAVNAPDHHLDKIDIMEALFGSETFVLRGGQGVQSEPEMIRQPDGAWVGPRGRTNTRVSAVLVVSSLTPWSAAAYSPELYLNPYARYPYVGPLLTLPSHRPVGERLERFAGRDGRELIDLPEGWPLVLRGTLNSSAGAG